MRTPFENKSLVATDGYLNFVASKSQRVEIPANERFNFGNADFTWSFILHNCTEGIVVQITNADGTNFYMGRSGDNSVYIVLNPEGAGQITLGAVGLPELATSSVRLTMVRIGSTLYAYVNNRLAGTGAISSAVNLGRDPFSFGRQASGAYTTGGVSQFIVLNGKGMTADELDSWHYTNVLPASTHPYVVAHFRMNETHGATLIDSVEDYNYARLQLLGSHTPNPSFWQGSPIITSGSDADGSYKEIELTSDISTGLKINQGADSQGIYNHVFAPSYRVINRFTGKVKFKIVGPTFDGLALYFGGINCESDVNNTNTPVDTLVTRTYHMVSPTGGNIDFAMYFSEVNGAFAGMKFRLYDVEIVETVVDANPGTLINYTSDELAIKSGEAPFYGYAKSKKYFKGNDVNVYGQMQNFSGETLPAFTMYIKFLGRDLTGLPGYNSSSHVVANLADSAYDPITSFMVRVDNNGGFVGTPVVTAPLGTIVTDAVYELLVKFEGGIMYRSLNGESFYPFSSGLSPMAFAGLWFNSSYGGTYSSIPTGRFILLDHAASDYETNFLRSKEKDYRTLPGTIADVDFSDLFKSGSDFFARDLSGNSRHVKLYNYSAAVPPHKLNQSTGLPDRKALKFSGTNQKITVSSFNVTKEKGYTVACLVKETNNATPVQGQPTFFASGDSLQLIGKEADNGLYAYNQIGGSTPKLNLDRRSLTSFTMTFSPSMTIDGLAAQCRVKVYVNGTVTRTSRINYSEVVEFINTLELWADRSIAGRYLDGHAVHSSIFKGEATASEIYDLHVLNKPPARLWADCQLYLNYDEIINDAGTYRVKDWSPANRTANIQLVNFSADEVNPAHADYRLFDLDEL